MLVKLLDIGRQIMSGWMKESYLPLKEAMADTTTERNGLPYGEAFTEIWHFAFGETNRRLAERGFMANPYGESAAWEGFVPFIRHTSIYDF